MTQNEQNLINKINEMQNVIEWQKKAIEQRDQVNKNFGDTIMELRKMVQEFEVNEEKLKREWYIKGSDDNFKSLVNIGIIKQ